MSTQETKLKAIADAIREKDGTTEPISANDFPDRIRAIETGGKLPEGVRTITLTADPPEGGTVSGGGYASDGMTVTVKAKAESGYYPAGWQENEQTVSENAEYTFSISSDHELLAVFEMVPPRLPNGYTELEYFITPYGAWINSNIKVNFSTTRIVLDVEPKSFSASVVEYFLNSSTSNPYLFINRPNDDKINYRFSTKSVASASLNISNKRIVLDWDFPTSYLNIGEQRIYTGRASSTGGYIHLFSSQSPDGCKFYSAQIYDNGDIVRDFVPCKNPSGEVGAYDMIGETFYKSENVSFVAGPIV